MAGRTRFVDIGIDISIRLEQIIGYLLDSCGSGQGQIADSCERGNEYSSSVKEREFLD
jgi:hypothetical protein